MKPINGIALLLASFGLFMWLLWPDKADHALNSLNQSPPGQNSVGPSLSEPPSIVAPVPALVDMNLSGLVEAFEVINESNVRPVPVLKAEARPAGLLLYDRSKLQRLQPGSQLHLPIPPGNDHYLVDIHQVDVLASGNLSIRGQLVGTPLTAVFTLGTTSFFGSVDTPTGIYNLIGNDQVAWIVPARQLRQHVDGSVSDFQLVGANKPKGEP